MPRARSPTSVEAGGVADGAPQALTARVRAHPACLQSIPRRRWKNGETVLSARLDACSTDVSAASVGRVVRAADGPGLENQWAAMSRGFESHTLRRI